MKWERLPPRLVWHARTFSERTRKTLSTILGTSLIFNQYQLAQKLNSQNWISHLLSSELCSWSCGKETQRKTSALFKQQEHVLMNHAVLSLQTGNQVPWGSERLQPGMQRGRPKEERLGRAHSLWPCNLGQQESAPCSLACPAQLIGVQQACPYWPDLLWFKFQTAHSFILSSPALKANHYGFYRPQSPGLTHSICTIFA